MKVARNPSKNYGSLEWFDVMPTLLATDYKSPPIVKEYEYEIAETPDGEEERD